MVEAPFLGCRACRVGRRRWGSGWRRAMQRFRRFRRTSLFGEVLAVGVFVGSERLQVCTSVRPVEPARRRIPIRLRGDGRGTQVVVVGVR